MSKPTPEPSSTPGRSFTLPGWVLPAVFVVLALRVGFLIYDRNFSSYDDGVAAEGARLVLQGHVPYRDFWTMYSPGSFYVNALGLALFGNRLIVVRLVSLLLWGVQAVLLGAILRRVSRYAAASIGAAMVYLAFVPVGIPAYWFTTALAAVYALTRFIEHQDSSWPYVCGIFLGLTVLMRQDAGLYLLAVMLPLLYLVTQTTGYRRLAPAAKTGGTVIAICTGAFAYFAIQGALPQIIKDTLYFPLFVFPKSRPLPYPIPWREVLVIGQYSAPVWIAGLYQLTVFYVLPAALVVLSVVSVRRFLRDGHDKKLAYAAILCIIAMVLFVMVGVRPSGARVSASVVMGAVAFAALAWDSSRFLRISARTMLAGLVIACVPFGAYSVWAQRSYATTVIGGTGGMYAAPGHAEALSVVCAKVRELTSPSEKILCGAPIIYFIAERDPGTRYYEPHPLLTDTPEVQREIIRNMESNHVRYFVRSLEWDLKNGYFTIEQNHQPSRLIEYIEKNYRMRFDYVVFQIYERVTAFPAGKSDQGGDSSIPSP